MRSQASRVRVRWWVRSLSGVKKGSAGPGLAARALRGARRRMRKANRGVFNAILPPIAPMFTEEGHCG
jgi:hypothetical protein